MTVGELLSDLSRRGIRVEAAGGRLRYQPRSALTTELAEQLRIHKPAILHYLQTGEILLNAKTATVAEVKNALDFFAECQNPN